MLRLHKKGYIEARVLFICVTGNSGMLECRPNEEAGGVYRSILAADVNCVNQMKPR